MTSALFELFQCTTTVESFPWEFIGHADQMFNELRKDFHGNNNGIFCWTFRITFLMSLKSDLTIVKNNNFAWIILHSYVFDVFTVEKNFFVFWPILALKFQLSSAIYCKYIYSIYGQKLSAKFNSINIWTNIDTIK